MRDGALSLAKLEAMTAVCSVGLDMVAVPGDTPASTLAGIIADEMAIGMVNHKTTAVRIIPVPGKGPGETVEWGGLLGTAIVQDPGPLRLRACCTSAAGGSRRRCRATGTRASASPLAAVAGSDDPRLPRNDRQAPGAPGIDPSSERPNPLDPEPHQLERHTGARQLVGSRTVDDDVSFSRDLAMPLVDLLEGHDLRTLDDERVCIEC